MTSTSLYAVRNTGGTFDKVDIILDAYSQLRISGITRSPTPEDLETALQRLEDMAAEFATTSDDGGYMFEDSPDPNSPCGIPRGYKQAYATNLAVRLIPDFNKAVPPRLEMQAGSSLSNMIARLAAERMREVSYPSRMPIGSGVTSRFSRWARFYRNEGEAPLSSTTVSLFVGDTHDFTQHYGSELASGETVDSYSLVVDSALTVVSDSLSSPDISYRLKATAPTGDDATNVQQVTIVATTSGGRIMTRRHFVEIIPTGAS